MKKKGELTTQQIVMLIILIVSFAVILYFIFLFDFPGETKKEICHNSVVLKDKSSSIAGNLDCTTSYICLSAGSDCDFVFDEKIEIDLRDDGKNLERVLNETREIMADCWWIFGEGKFDYYSKFLSGDSACAVCSIIKFDSEIQNEFSGTSYRSLYENLGIPINSRETYLHYLYGVGDLEDLEENFELEEIDGEEYLNQRFDFNKEYFVLTGMSKTSFLVTTGDSNFIPVVIMEKTKENYDKVGCDEFITKA